MPTWHFLWDHLLPRTLTRVGCCLILGSCCQKRNKPFPYPEPGSSGHIQRAQEHVVRTKRTLVPPEPPPGSSSPRTLPYGILVIQAQSLGQRAMRGARMRSRGSRHLSLCTATPPRGFLGGVPSGSTSCRSPRGREPGPGLRRVHTQIQRGHRLLHKYLKKAVRTPGQP